MSELETTATETATETFEFVTNHGKAVNLPRSIKVGDEDVDLQTIIGHAISKTRKDTKSKVENEYSKYIQELNTIKEEYNSTASRLKEVEEKDLGAKDKEILQLKRQLEGFETEKKKLSEQSQANFEQYKNERIQSDIFKSFSGYELHNQNHTLTQFKNDCKVDFEQDQEGNYKTVITTTLPNDKGEYETVTGTPKDVFSKWIALESNAYLLKNNLKSGGGTSKTGASITGTGQLQYKRSQLQDPAIRNEYNEKRKAGLDVGIIQD